MQMSHYHNLAFNQSNMHYKSTFEGCRDSRRHYMKSNPIPTGCRSQYDALCHPYTLHFFIFILVPQIFNGWSAKACQERIVQGAVTLHMHVQWYKPCPCWITLDTRQWHLFKTVLATWRLIPRYLAGKYEDSVGQKAHCLNAQGWSIYVRRFSLWVWLKAKLWHSFICIYRSKFDEFFHNQCRSTM